MRFDPKNRAILKRKARHLQNIAPEDDLKLSDLVVTHVIGQGAFGRVFLGTYLRTGEKFAIKNIRKDRLVQHRETINTVNIEYQVLFESNHPFLCSMDYYFSSEERLYFVMPFISGGEMHQILKSRDKFPEAEVKFYIAQVVLAVAVLHSNFIMHRDLKPANLMLDSDGYLKVIDFGLATVLRYGLLAYESCGTPAYMAPEILQKRGYEFSADWWAVGIMMYEMQFGYTPFHNKRKAFQD